MRLARIGKRLMPRDVMLKAQYCCWKLLNGQNALYGARNFLDGSQGAFHTEGNMNLYTINILILLLLHSLSQTKPHAPDEILL